MTGRIEEKAISYPWPAVILTVASCHPERMSFVILSEAKDLPFR
jgi:hypothetical protein